ncbi:TrmB family transcriptional regulator sugar-binding domain-containing protein [Haloarcula laminariae]|uniref:TrmB family transcriptional regulator sugar-binding domain-containing protein n=1 Tax=Haloarcula laminariae TaxID=2961577 RepID=UPI0021CAC5F0|nr:MULTISPECIES: TrmB family transcriptional regulator sugar-binding domain-containing protein [Halomicroarcula]
MTRDRLRENLRLLGLSAKEIAVYLTILDHGTVTVSRVVDESDVSQRHVYQMCEQLDERGLVVLNDHVRPSVVRAQRADSAVSSIDARLAELEADIESELADQDVADLEVELIKSGQTLAKRWRRDIDAAEAEVFICLPAAVFDRFTDALADALDRGAAVYVLVTDPGLDAFDTAALEECATLARTWAYEPQPLLTVDRERMALDDPGFLVGGGDGSAISLTRSAVTGNLFSTYLGNFWRLATEVYRCDRDPLPQSYPTLRNALVQATLYERAGVDLTATITARDMTTGEIVELASVPILEVRQGLMDPFSNEFPIENSVHVGHDGEVVTVGGVSAVIEDYEAMDIRLERAPQSE